MGVIHACLMIIMFLGASLWRERYGLHDPTMPAKDSIDTRVKYGNRILTIFHMITYFSGSLSSLNDEIDFTRFAIGSFYPLIFMIGSQMLLQFILMLLSAFYVQYDIQVSNKEKFKEDARNLIKQQDIQYKENCDSYLEIENLKNEISKHKAKIHSLESQFRDVKYINSSLYSRLDRITEKDNAKQRSLTELFNKFEEYKTLVPEGDYITMCNLFKNLYE